MFFDTSTVATYQISFYSKLVGSPNMIVGGHTYVGSCHQLNFLLMLWWSGSHMCLT